MMGKHRSLGYNFSLLCCAFAVAAGVNNIAAAGDSADCRATSSTATPFRLVVHESEGNITYIYKPNSKELESISAEKEVSLNLGSVAIKADKLQYISPGDIASPAMPDGSRIEAEKVDMRLEKSQLDVRCDKLVFDRNTDVVEATGNVSVNSRNAWGGVTTTHGEKILISGVSKNPKLMRGAGGHY